MQAMMCQTKLIGKMKIKEYCVDIASGVLGNQTHVSIFLQSYIKIYDYNH